jgi:chromosome segregation ATPase
VKSLEEELKARNTGELENTILSLKSQLEEALRALSFEKIATDLLHEEEATSRARLSELEVALALSSNESNQLKSGVQTSVSNLEVELLKKQNELDLLKQDYGFFRDRSDSEEKRLNGSLEEALKALVAEKSANDLLQAELAKSTSSVQAYMNNQSSIDSSQEKIIRLEETISHMTRENEMLTREVALLESSRKALEESNKLTVIDLGKSRDLQQALELELTKSREEVAKLGEALKESSRSIDESLYALAFEKMANDLLLEERLTRQAANEEEKIQALTRRIEELRVEVSDSRYAHEMKSKELTHALVECESNKVSIDKLKSELNEFEVEQKSLNVENQSLREEVSKCKQETSRVNYDLSLLQAKYDSLLEKSSKQEEAVSKAQSELAESNKRLAVTMHINSGVSNWLTYQYTFVY